MRTSELYSRNDNGLVGDELQIFAINLEHRAFFAAARRETDSANLIAAAADADVVRARQTAANQQARARGSHIGVIRCADRDSQIEIAIVEDRGALPVPALHHIDDAVAQNVGNEEAAIEQDGVRLRIRCAQKCGQVPRDGGIGNVRQAELPEHAALLFLGLLLQIAEGKEALQAPVRELPRAGSQFLSVPPMSPVPAPRTVMSTFCSFGSDKQPLFGRRALTPQAAALPQGKRCSELALDQPRQRQVEVVAAEQQVLADSGAREFDAIALAVDADQCEVAGAAADIANQYDLPIEQALLRLREMVGDPGIERSGRLFDQRQVFNTGLLRRLYCQLARFFIERCGYRQHDDAARSAVRLAGSPKPRRKCCEVLGGNLDRR